MNKNLSIKVVIGLLYFLDIAVCAMFMFEGTVSGNPLYLIAGTFFFAVLGILITKNEQSTLVNIYEK